MRPALRLIRGFGAAIVGANIVQFAEKTSDLASQTSENKSKHPFQVPVEALCRTLTKHKKAAFGATAKLDEQFFSPHQPLTEGLSLVLSLGAHYYMHSAPTDNYINNLERKRLHDALLERCSGGKLSETEFHVITMTNDELYKNGIELTKCQSDAILNAIDEMYKHRGEFLTNPRAWISAKWLCETKIAEAFGQEGDYIGSVAHRTKGLAESALCIATQTIVKAMLAHQEKVNRVVPRKIIDEENRTSGIGVVTSKEPSSVAFKAAIQTAKKSDADLNEEPGAGPHLPNH